MADEVIKPRYRSFLDFEETDIDKAMKQFKIHSTDTSRTIETANTQTQALYQNIKAEMANHYEILPEDEDFLIHMGVKNCNFLKKMMNHAKNSEHQNYVDEFANYLLTKYLRDITTGFLPEDGKPLKAEKMKSVFVDSESDQTLVDHGRSICSYVYWAN